MEKISDQIENLIELNDELENYFRNTIIPQLYVDAGLILQKYTPPAMKQFKLSPGDVGKHIDDIKDNFRFPNLIDNIKHVIDSNEILEKEIQTTDFRWYQMNIIPYVILKSYKKNGVIITFVEITRRIKDLNEQERLIADYETLLDIISHDIKGPLSTMVIAIELFKNVTPEDSNNFHSLLKVVEEALKQMRTIIIELMETREKEYKYKAGDELLNFENILEDVRYTLTDNILKSGAVIKTEINVSEIFFSRRKLRSIIYNLMNNAIKYKSPERRPEIFIKTEKENDFIVISVTDNGLGIETSKQNAVFLKYFRAEKAIEGSGIGLYLVKEIVTNAGGKILLKSELGKGSQFKIYLKAE